MMRDKLSRREDRALLKALRELTRTRFPNPDRKNCPGTPVLHAIATKRVSMLDSAQDRKSTRLNSSHLVISYAVFCLKKKKKILRLSYMTHYSVGLLNNVTQYV